MRAVAFAAGAALGAVLAVFAVAVHRIGWRVGGVLVPWGLALAVTTPVVCSVAAGLLAGKRAGRLAFGAGWLSTIVVLMLGRPEGDVVIAPDWLGWTFLALGVGPVAILLGAALGSADRSSAGG